MKFSIKDFFSKKFFSEKFLMENFIFCAVIVLNNLGFCGCVKILAPIWCDEIWHVFRMLISYNMANIFRISHILFLFNLPQDYWNKSAKYEKLGKYWPYCTRNCAMTRWLMLVLFYQASVSYFSKYFKSKFLYNIFFLSGFSFTNIHKSQDCRGRGRAFL